MEIRWSIPAAEDLERICEHIERDSPEGVKGVRLDDHPDVSIYGASRKPAFALRSFPQHLIVESVVCSSLYGGSQYLPAAFNAAPDSD